MARNWLRHHVDAQDGQVVIRKIVVSPTVTSPSSVSETANGRSMTPAGPRDRRTHQADARAPPEPEGTVRRAASTLIGHEFPAEAEDEVPSTVNRRQM